MLKFFDGTGTAGDFVAGVHVCVNEVVVEVYVLDCLSVQATWNDSEYPPSTLRSALISNG